MSSNKKLFIFDLDGTLLDTARDLSLAVNHSLKLFGLDQISENDVKAFTGNGIKMLVKRSLEASVGAVSYSSALFDGVFQEFKDHYAIHSNDNTKPYDGIIKLLTTLKNDGHTLTVLSNKIQSEVSKLINTHFPEMFDHVIGVSDVIPPKPDLGGISYIIEHAGFSKNDCLYIGDSEVDIETARLAKLRLICVSWGFRTKKQLTEFYSPGVIIDSPSELISII